MRGSHSQNGVSTAQNETVQTDACASYPSSGAYAPPSPKGEGLGSAVRMRRETDSALRCVHSSLLSVGATIGRPPLLSVISPSVAVRRQLPRQEEPWLHPLSAVCLSSLYLCLPCVKGEVYETRSVSRSFSSSSEHRRFRDAKPKNTLMRSAGGIVTESRNNPSVTSR